MLKRFLPHILPMLFLVIHVDILFCQTKYDSEGTALRKRLFEINGDPSSMIDRLPELLKDNVGFSSLWRNTKQVLKDPVVQSFIENFDYQSEADKVKYDTMYHHLNGAQVQNLRLLLVQMRNSDWKEIQALWVSSGLSFRSPAVDIVSETKVEFLRKAEGLRFGLDLLVYGTLHRADIVVGSHLGYSMPNMGFALKQYYNTGVQMYGAQISLGTPSLAPYKSVGITGLYDPQRNSFLVYLTLQLSR